MTSNHHTNASSDIHDPFAAIRPYADREVAEVLARLAHDPELLDALTHYRLPRLARFMPRLARAVASLAVRREVRGVDSVKGFQTRIAGYMQRMIRTTTDDF
ncbi:MAG TPA: glycerol acyltransferase, partial [Halomonas sp.]|nr:glycerol acyltransferase [Halomonas sp.]